MDKNMIGRNAGIVWELLTSRQHTYWSYEELKSATSLSDRELNTAKWTVIPGQKRSVSSFPSPVITFD